jgi:UDP-glucose 4-epimerase
VNQTINLAYGQGNTLVHCADRIAAELGVEPKMSMAPALLGEVTHYVADISKARELIGYEPQVPLDEGIARAVGWFRERRAAHPDEDVPVAADHEGTPRDAGVLWKSASVP